MANEFSAYDNRKVTGIFGGSFDPVHVGHLSLAAELLQIGRVEHVIFMPAARSPHKLSGVPVSAEDRVNMIRSAITDMPNTSVSCFEVDRGGVSYTLDTLTAFSEYFGDNLRMIIGMDSLCDLHKWYKARVLLDLCGFITYCRPGYPKPDADQLRASFGDDGARRLLEGIVEAQLYHVSSTDLRRDLKSGKFSEIYMPKAVCSYIKQHQLYT